MQCKMRGKTLEEQESRATRAQHRHISEAVGVMGWGSGRGREAGGGKERCGI